MSVKKNHMDVSMCVSMTWEAITVNVEGAFFFRKTAKVVQVSLNHHALPIISINLFSIFVL